MSVGLSSRRLSQPQQLPGCPGAGCLLPSAPRGVDVAMGDGWDGWMAGWVGGCADSLLIAGPWAVQRKALDDVERRKGPRGPGIRAVHGHGLEASGVAPSGSITVAVAATATAMCRGRHWQAAGGANHYYVQFLRASVVLERAHDARCSQHSTVDQTGVGAGLRSGRG